MQIRVVAGVGYHFAGPFGAFAGPDVDFVGPAVLFAGPFGPFGGPAGLFGPCLRPLGEPAPPCVPGGRRIVGVLRYFGPRPAERMLFWWMLPTEGTCGS